MMKAILLIPSSIIVVHSDGLPFWVWRDNYTSLAPAVTALWNKSLSSYTWSTAWKEANINPLPKVDAPVQYSDFRGINVTPVIACCFEENLTVTQYVSNLFYLNSWIMH